MGLVAFLAAVAIWPHTASAVLFPRWAVMSVGLACLLYGAKVRPTAAHAVGLMLWLYAALSLLWVVSLPEGLDALWKLTVLGMAFLVGASWPRPQALYRGMAMGVAVSGMVAIFQVNGISLVDQLAAPAGLFGNKNFMGEIAVLALIPCVAYRWWALLPPVATALWLSGCRSAWLALVAAAILWLWGRSRALASAAALAVVLLGSVIALGNPARFDLDARFAIWQDTWAGVNAVGNGIGSMWTEYPRYATHTDATISRTEHAHNDLLEQGFELGIPGVLALLALFALGMAGGDAVERAVLVAGAVDGMFGFPLHEPATSLFLAVVAGRAAGRRYFLFRRLGGSGVPLCDGLVLGLRRWLALLRAARGRADIPAQSLPAGSPGLRRDNLF